MSCKAILAEDIPFLLSYCMTEYLRKFIHIHIPDYDIKEKKNNPVSIYYATPCSGPLH